MIPWGLVLRAAGALAFVLSVAYGWHVLTDRYREQGRVEVHAELDPQLAHQTKRATDALAANRSLVADLASLKAAVDRQDAEIAGYRERALRAEIAARKAMLAAAQAAKRYDAEVARLTALAGAPVITEDDCAAAKGILARLAGRAHD